MCLLSVNIDYVVSYAISPVSMHILEKFGFVCERQEGILPNLFPYVVDWLSNRLDSKAIEIKYCDQSNPIFSQDECSALFSILDHSQLHEMLTFLVNQYATKIMTKSDLFVYVVKKKDTQYRT